MPTTLLMGGGWDLEGHQVTGPAKHMRLPEGADEFPA